MKKTLIILAVVLAAWAAYAFWPRKSGQTFSYQAVTVTRGDLSKSIQASGSVAPQNRVDLRPPFAGRLEDVLVREGDWVKKGQILAWLSSTERAALLDAARARGPEELKKWEELYRATPMLSPITGTLIARSFEPGQGVGASDAVLTVSDRLIVRATVDETDIAQVQVGQAARLTLDAYPDQPFEAKAVHIAYEAKTVSNVTVYEVEVAPAKTPAFMRSGMTASIDFYTEKHPDVLMIPNEAIQPRKDNAAGKKGGNAMADALRAAVGVTGTADAGSGQRKGNGQGGQRPEGGWQGKHCAGGQAAAGQGSQAGHGRRSTVLLPGVADKDGKLGEPVEKEVRLGLTDGKNTEVLDGLAEGDTVMIKSVALPSASGAGTNPFMPGRPTGGGGGGGTRGAR